MTPAQIAKIMALVDQYAATRNAGYIGSFGTPAEARAAVEAALSDAPRAGGWVMVPVEPTQTMMQQGKHALYEESMGDFDASLLEIKATYRAMLSARPSAPTAVEPPELSMSMFASVADFEAAKRRAAVEPDERAMANELIKVAAWLLSPEPRRKLAELEDATHIGHRQFHRAYEGTFETLRLKAIEIRNFVDAARASKGTP